MCSVQCLVESHVDRKVKELAFWSRILDLFRKDEVVYQVRPGGDESYRFYELTREEAVESVKNYTRIFPDLIVQIVPTSIRSIPAEDLRRFAAIPFKYQKDLI